MNKNKKIDLEFKMGYANRLKYRILDTNGNMVRESKWHPNLILKQGMDNIGIEDFTSLWTFCAVGTGTTPTSFSTGGSVTLTTSGTTVTASSAFFSSTNVGDTIVISTGFPGSAYALITGYTSSTVVTVNKILNLSSPTDFTIYYTSQTGLSSEVKRSYSTTESYNTFQSPPGMNFTSIGDVIDSGPAMGNSIVTYQRLFVFPVETSNSSYTEIGFSSTNTAGNNLFSRAFLEDEPVSLFSGQYLAIIYQITVCVYPVIVGSWASAYAGPFTQPNISGWPSLAYPVTFDYTSNLVTATNGSYPFINNSETNFVSFQGTTAPGGIAFGTNYFISTQSETQFALDEYPNGTPQITITSDGAGVYMFYNTMGLPSLVGQAVAMLQPNGTEIETENGEIGAVTDVGSLSLGNFLVGYSEGSFNFGPIGNSNAWANPYTFPSEWPNETGIQDLSNASDNVTVGGYTSGTFNKTFSGTISGSVSSSISYVYLSADNLGTSGYIFAFAYPQEIASGYSLTLNFNISWGWVFN